MDRNVFVSIVGAICQTCSRAAADRLSRDGKAAASCRADRAEQAGNGDGHSESSETPAQIDLRFV